MSDAQKQQPTILVKKPDGTTERVALDQVLKRGAVAIKGSPQVPPLVGEAKEGFGRELAPSRPTSTALATATPVQKIFIDEAKASAWDAEDHRSPLDEPIDLNRHSASRLLPHDRNDEVDKVIRRSGVSIDPALRPRLASVIQSRIKEIRTDDQVVRALHRSLEQGGIDCTAQEAEAILLAITEVCQLKTPRQEQSKKPTPAVLSIASSLSLAPKAPPRSLPPTRPLASGVKPVLHDIHPPIQSGKPPHVTLPTDLFSHTETVGPIDEIRGMTLENLRKLGNNQKERAERFLLKFQRLREEDILGFLEAEEAWYESPAYREYQKALLTSIKEHRPLFDVAKEQGISEEDLVLITERA